MITIAFPWQSGNLRDLAFVASTNGSRPCIRVDHIHLTRVGFLTNNENNNPNLTEGFGTAIYFFAF